MERTTITYTFTMTGNATSNRDIVTTFANRSKPAFQVVTNPVLSRPQNAKNPYNHGFVTMFTVASLHQPFSERRGEKSSVPRSGSCPAVARSCRAGPSSTPQNQPL